MSKIPALVLTLVFSIVSLAQEGRSTPLVEAAGRDDIAAVRSLLAGGADPNEVDNSGVKDWTPLMAAAKARSADVAEALLKAHANVNATNGYGWTALDVAIAYWGDSSTLAGIIEAAGGKGAEAGTSVVIPRSLPAAGEIGGGAYRIGVGVSPPVPTYRPDPDYSEAARKAKYQGTVILAIVVDEKGNPKDVRVVKPLGLGLDQKAIEAVEKWRFRPGMKDGHPVKVMAQIEVNFRLLVNGWNMGRIEFQLPAGASAAAVHSTHFENPKPRTSGTVWLAFDIDEKGKPNNVRAVRSTNHVLESAATASIRKWRFHPAMKEGQPISASGTVDLIFQP